CKSAAARGVAPETLADEVVVHFQDLWKELEITNDDFIRTSQVRHVGRVRELIARLEAKGDIYRGEYEGWYDEGQEEFVTENTASASGYLSEVSGKPLTRYREVGYFFRLTRWIPPLIEHIEAHPDFIQPVSRRNEVLSKLRQGVDDLCISRPAEKLMNWGVPMPGDTTHSVYVWVDALCNYLTALGYPDLGDGEPDRYSRFWPADVHLLGKDILWFHGVYWPGILMALGVPLPRKIYAHGWWMSEGRKMSKTLGNFVSGETIRELCREYSVDVFRYYLLRAVPFGQDGNFSREALFHLYNAELANGIGNLVSRTVNMIGRYCEGRIPTALPGGEAEAPVLAAAARLAASVPALAETLGFQDYLARIVDLERETNRYIEVTEPFKLAKDPAEMPRVKEILRTCAEAVRLILVHLEPVMPVKAAAGLAMLGLDSDSELGRRVEWGNLSPGTAVRKGAALFPRKAALPGAAP
ncbi:MAG TPA: methionine--tRNA ligase, partial [bacterium]|nr:methionine--tRNA ligase [bacterium]